MADATARFKLNDKPLKRLLKELRGKRKQLDKMYKQWGIIYMAAMRRRFRNFSRGGGNWEPLTASTIEAKGSTSILIDLGFLFNALTPGASGNKFQRTRDGIIVGMVGAGNHPPSGLSIAELADVHHTGKGVPARELMVGPEPGGPIIKQFIKAAQRAIENTARGRS
ncbi:hypothetical protein LCGC14_0392390 [marine sediment metagenome]|uniref:Phage virion morphogenesis protein n=1 Tax=marine sediment metagenome TaxID=412755 RepID=A0A0F9SZF1_9ZZZZ